MRCLITLWIAAAATLPAAETLTLEQALRTARGREGAAETRARMAGERVVMLEALSHRKLELRPQLSLLSLTNPMSLVTGLGLSFLGGTAGVSPVTLLAARVDLVEAEVTRERQLFQREAETTQLFYELAGRQKAAEVYCDAVAGDDVAVLTRKLEAGQITKIEVLRRQQAQLDQEGVCRDAQRGVQIAVLRLAKAVGLPPENLRVQAEPVAAVRSTHSLQAAPNLVETSFTKRPDVTTLDQHMTQVRTEVAALRDPRSIRVSLFSSRSALTSTGPYQPALTAGLAFGRDVSFQFEKHLVQMHVRMVEDDLDRLKEDVAEHLAELRIECDARQQEADAAVRRTEFATQYRQAIEARWKAGLETSQSVVEAVTAERRAKVEFAKAAAERDAALSTILSLCGLRGGANGTADGILLARNSGR